jgi:hypothetical protein
MGVLSTLQLYPGLLWRKLSNKAKTLPVSTPGKQTPGETAVSLTSSLLGTADVYAIYHDQGNFPFQVSNRQDNH